MIKTVSLLFSLFFLSSCASLTLPNRIVNKLVTRDLVRVSEMAEKYGKPAVAQCTTYLVGALEGRQELLSEDVDGVISLAFKAYLLKEISHEDGEKFKAECGPLAAELLLQIGRDLRD